MAVAPALRNLLFLVIPTITGFPAFGEFAVNHSSITGEMCFGVEVFVVLVLLSSVLLAALLNGSLAIVGSLVLSAERRRSQHAPFRTVVLLTVTLCVVHAAVCLLAFAAASPWTGLLSDAEYLQGLASVLAT